MNVATKNLEYTVGNTKHVGYLAWDQDISGFQPGIVVVHEWWGINDYIRARAQMLAQQGYCALAIDMYGNGNVAANPDEAGASMNSVLENMDSGTERLNAGYSTLLNQPQVDSSRTAAIGYCFGGAMVLHMARIGLPLKAVVSFHGALGSFHKPQIGDIKANILVCHGGADAMVTMDDVATFKREMDEAKANYEVVVYEGALHGFTSKEADQNGEKYSLPLGYDANADAASWTAMEKLFQKLL